MSKKDDTKTLEILLIEDNEDDAERIEQSLDSERYHIKNAWNGKKALDFMIRQDNDIDVVLLDKGLPYKNGLEILKDIGKKGKEYAFIFLTIDNTIETAVEAMKLGALDFLPKSSGFEGLPEMIEKVHEIHKNKLERKKAEEALQESLGRYRSLTDDVLDSSAVGIFILDSDLRIVWVNQALEDYFGVKRNEIIGKDKRQLIHEKIKDIFMNSDSFANKVFTTYDDNTYIERFECHVLPNNEREERWLEHRSQPIQSGLYAGGRIEHYYDITKRKQAERELQERINELETFHRTTLGREGRVIELKHEVNELLEQLGKKKKYGNYSK